MPYKILSIEDTTSFRRLIRMALEFDGFDVIEAEGGQRGLELAKAEVPDLILLDLMMPDISGLEVCQALKKDARLCKIPIIVLSSSDDSDEIEACLQLGAQDYLLKPFRPAMLLELAKKYVTAAGGV
jgi:two-component system alkaline phosphatase synthesis response regulator PhoP